MKKALYIRDKCQIRPLQEQREERVGVSGGVCVRYSRCHCQNHSHSREGVGASALRDNLHTSSQQCFTR